MLHTDINSIILFYTAHQNQEFLAGHTDTQFQGNAVGIPLDKTCLHSKSEIVDVIIFDLNSYFNIIIL